MAQQNSLKYCSKTTKAHQISKGFSTCLEKLDDISRNEGCKKPPFSEEIALNLDKVENLKAQKESRSKNRTIDIFIGVTNDKNKRILLCEYKLRLKSPTNLSQREIKEKIDNTKKMVGHSPPLSPEIIFLFKPNQVNQAYNILRRFFPTRRDLKSSDIQSFKNSYF